MTKGTRMYWFLLQMAGIGAGIIGGVWLFNRITS